MKRIVPFASLLVLGLVVIGSVSQPAAFPEFGPPRPRVEPGSTADQKATSPSNSSGDRERREITLPQVLRTTPIKVRFWESIDDLPEEIAIFETVFWDPRDTESLRKRIRETSLVKGKTVLEIGTGSGLLSLCCLQNGARRVVATDVNRAAICNAAYNAHLFGWNDRLELRVVPLDDASAFSVIEGAERFDLIVSNPPWEDARPDSIDEYALYDTGFRLVRSLLTELRDHLKPEGRALLAYGSVTAIRTILRLADECKLDVQVLDTRDLDDLSDVFLPGMMLEVTPAKARGQ